MRLRPVHLFVILILFILIKNRSVLAGRKYFLKKLLKGAVLASLIRPQYVPLPIPIPLGHNVGPLAGHLNTPHHMPIPMPQLHHHQSWPASRHYSHHLPELPLNHYNPVWSGWSNELAASMRSPIISQAPNQLASSMSTMGMIPFGLPMNPNQESNSLLTNKATGDYQSATLPANLPTMDNLIYTPNDHLTDHLDPLSARASTSAYSFRKLFKKDLKKKLI